MAHRSSAPPRRPAIGPVVGTWPILGALFAVGGCDFLISLPETPEAVEISPTSLEADAVFDTLEFTIRVLDSSGREISFNPTIASTNPNVLQVTAAREIVTVGNGEATVRVIAGSIFATAWVEVAQVAVEADAVGGDGQEGDPGEALPDPLVVELRDRLGTPAAGIQVRFTVREGGGTVDPEVVVTGADGRASSYWTLGTTGGVQRIEAAPDGEPGPAIWFEAAGR